VKRIIFLSFLLVGLTVNAKGQTIDPPELIRVTIDTATQDVNLYWTASTTKNILFYEIRKWDYYQGSLSGVSQGKVYDPSVFEFSLYDPEVLRKPVGYYVLAYIDNDHASGWSNLDSTIYLKSMFDSCKATILLQWNDYNTWRGKIGSYKLYESINGAPYQMVNSFNEGINQTIIDVNADQSYRFFVLTTKNNLIDLSYSNISMINTKMAVIPSKIDADYGTVTNNQPVVSFSIDSSSELTHYILLRSNSAAGPYDSLTSIETNDKIIEYHDPVSASEQPYYYRLKALNYCMQDARISENTASTIFLQVKNSGTSIGLNWTAYENWMGGVSTYHIERMLNGGTYENLASLNNLNYDDQSLTSLIGTNVGSEVCYRIVAIEESGKQLTSTSNEVCTELPVNIRFEFNAFVPGSTDNSTFGPKIDFVPQSFSFKIFNRWGMKVFESDDPMNARWDGIYSGNSVPEGVYRYQLVYRNEYNKNVVLQGEVTVVYP